MSNDIRYIQRFSNYKKALKGLDEAVELLSSRELSNLEKQGLIQAFEYTYELAWKVIKDFLNYKGMSENIFGSRDAFRYGFKYELLKNGDDWMDMIKSRNLASHIYDEEKIDEIIELISNIYIFRFLELRDKFDELILKDSL